jgi:hypothetical protein
MSIRARVVFCLLALVPTLSSAQALDPSTVTLNAASAEKFVRATQAMAASGEGPNMQGGGPGMDLAKVRASIDANPAAQKALAAAGISSTDYVLFLGAAMQSMMVGQMEAAGMRNMLPPGITKRPSQTNIDFMKANVDLFQRSMTPGAPVASSGARAAANTSDEALPMPKDAGAVLPSSILAKIPSLSTITASTDCSLGDLSATIERERAKAVAQEAAFYGNPGDSGLGRTPAERTVLEHADDSDLEACGSPMAFANPLLSPEWRTAEDQKSKEMDAVARDESDAWNNCPGIAGGKDPECERAVSAATARKVDEIHRRYLHALTPVFDGMISQMKSCGVKREAIVREAHTANVTGANVKLVLRPLVLAWELPPNAMAQWTFICEDAQRRLLKK